MFELVCPDLKLYLALMRNTYHQIIKNNYQCTNIYWGTKVWNIDINLVFFKNK